MVKGCLCHGLSSTQECLQYVTIIKSCSAIVKGMCLALCRAPSGFIRHCAYFEYLHNISLIVAVQLSIPDSGIDACNSRHWWSFIHLRYGYSPQDKLVRSWHHNSCNCGRSCRYRTRNRFVVM